MILHFVFILKQFILLETKNIVLYDPAASVKSALEAISCKYYTKLRHIDEILALPSESTVLLIGPYGLDKDTQFYTKSIQGWISKGGKVIVLEQNPGACSADCVQPGCWIRQEEPTILVTLGGKLGKTCRSG